MILLSGHWLMLANLFLVCRSTLLFLNLDGQSIRISDSFLDVLRAAATIFYVNVLSV